MGGGAERGAHAGHLVSLFGGELKSLVTAGMVLLGPAVTPIVVPSGRLGGE